MQRTDHNRAEQTPPRPRRPWLWLLVIPVITVGLCCGIGGIIAARVGTKGGAEHVDAVPRPNDAPAEPILQLEKHTCGFLAMSSAYEKYGLSPDDENLRYRLGVDRRGNPLDAESAGTLHPDIFRVLAADNFCYDLIDPGTDGAVAALQSHLDARHVALLLINRRQTGSLHWVLTDSRDGDRLRIVDSVFELPYHEPAEEFVRGYVLSIVTVKPAETPAVSLATTQAEGVAELARVRQRIKARQASSR